MKTIVNRLKVSLSDFINCEDGQISKKAIVGIGVSLAAIGIGSKSVSAICACAACSACGPAGPSACAACAACSACGVAACAACVCGSACINSNDLGGGIPQTTIEYDDILKRIIGRHTV